jgi:hypothetical protein
MQDELLISDMIVGTQEQLMAFLINEVVNPTIEFYYLRAPNRHLGQIQHVDTRRRWNGWHHVDAILHFTTVICLLASFDPWDPLIA